MPLTGEQTESIMRASVSRTAYFLEQARVEIDKIFGKGHSENNPDILAAFLSSCSVQFSAEIAGDRAEIARAIRGNLDSIQNGQP